MSVYHVSFSYRLNSFDCFFLEEVQVIPASEDFNEVWFRTGDGSPDKRTELPPFFVNFKCKVYPTSPGNVSNIDTAKQYHVA